MRMYKNSQQVEDCSTPELLHYRKYLKTITKDIRNDIEELGKVWRELNEELRYRIEFHELELIDLEKDRKDATTVEELIALDLQ